MISQTTKNAWGVALVSVLGAAGFWIYSSDPVRQAELGLLRKSSAESERLSAANRAMQASLPTEDVDALKAANSQLLEVQNQILALQNEIADLTKALANVRPEETEAIRQLATQNQQLAAVRAQHEAAVAQADVAVAGVAAPPVTDGGLPAPGGRSAAFQLIERLRGPDGSLSPEAQKAATDALKAYRDAHNGANAPSVAELLPYIPADLLREDSDEEFQVISRGPNGETRIPGEAIRPRRR